MCSMILVMTTTLLIGLILGFILQGNFALSTIGSILVGFIAASIISGPFQSSVKLEALCSSVMGSMMGAMVGEMTVASDINILLLFMDSLFIVSMAYMMMMFKKDIVEKVGVGKRRNPVISILFSSVLPIVILGIFNFWGTNISPTNSEQVDHHHHLEVNTD